MGTSRVAKGEIIKLLVDAMSMVPESHLPDLDPIDGYPDVPKWHKFENRIWEVGENIRQLMNSSPRLRSDVDLQDRYIEIAKKKHAKRGRQSFIMLLAYKVCTTRSEELVSELNDPFVSGQVIYMWRKMQTALYVEDVSPFINDPKKWIRDEAKKYIDKYGKA